MKKVSILLIALMVVSVGLLSGCLGKNEFKLINKCNIEICVIIISYDGKNYDSWLDDPNYEIDAEYVNANSEITIPNTLSDDSNTYIDVSTNLKHEHIIYGDTIPMYGHTSVTLTFHADGYYDYEYTD